MQREPDRLTASPFDILVVGGGIYGLAIAYDAAQRGASVALIERDDFGAGSSFNHLRTIHGGLRYLQSLDMARARASVRERRTLARIAPARRSAAHLRAPPSPLAHARTPRHADRIRARSDRRLRSQSGRPVDAAPRARSRHLARTRDRPLSRAVSRGAHRRGRVGRLCHDRGRSAHLQLRAGRGPPGRRARQLRGSRGTGARASPGRRRGGRRSLAGIETGHRSALHDPGSRRRASPRSWPRSVSPPIRRSCGR